MCDITLTRTRINSHISICYEICYENWELKSAYITDNFAHIDISFIAKFFVSFGGLVFGFRSFFHCIHSCSIISQHARQMIKLEFFIDWTHTRRIQAFVRNFTSPRHSIYQMELAENTQHDTFRFGRTNQIKTKQNLYVPLHFNGGPFVPIF